MKKKISVIVGILVITIAIVTTVVIVNNNNSNTENNRINVTIGVYDKDDLNIFKKSVDTEKEYLMDVLNDISELNIVTEDSQYGAYITSIMGIEQGNNYYWSYYIDDEYATVGVSSCKLEEGKKYNFKIEEMNY